MPNITTNHAITYTKFRVHSPGQGSDLVVHSLEQGCKMQLNKKRYRLDKHTDMLVEA